LSGTTNFGSSLEGNAGSAASAIGDALGPVAGR
jgi:hypothetical protein